MFTYLAFVRSGRSLPSIESGDVSKTTSPSPSHPPISTPSPTPSPSSFPLVFLYSALPPSLPLSFSPPPSFSLFSRSPSVSYTLMLPPLSSSVSYPYCLFPLSSSSTLYSSLFSHFRPSHLPLHPHFPAPFPNLPCTCYAGRVTRRDTY